MMGGHISVRGAGVTADSDHPVDLYPAGPIQLADKDPLSWMCTPLKQRPCFMFRQSIPLQNVFRFVIGNIKALKPLLQQ